MKLRAKLFAPLLIFSMLLGVYVHFMWLPQVAQTIEHRTQLDWQAHLRSVAEGLIPLLLEGQLANVHENLDALLEQNDNWLFIKLTSESGQQLYPLGTSPALNTFPGRHIHLLHQSVGFLEPQLAELEVVVNFDSVLAEVKKLEKGLSFAFLLMLTVFVLVIAGFFDWLIRRRLKKLGLAADQLARGYFDASLPKRNDDEIGDLVHSFTIMRDALQTNQQQLKGEIEDHRNTSIELVEQQEKIRNIIDNSTNLFYSQTVDQVMTYLSPQTKEFLDCESDIALKRWAEFFTDNPINDLRVVAQQEAIRTGEHQPPYVLELVGMKGRKILVEVHEAPVIHEGKIVAIVGSLTDITEQKQAEIEQSRLQRELLQAQKMEALGQFTGGVAHDFNNIMGIIQGYSELARNHCVQNEQDKVASYFDHIQNALNRAISLVSQMMAFSRDTDIELIPSSFQEIIKEDILMLRSLLPSSIKIESEIDEKLPKVMIDQTQINQLLINLSTNARDAMEGKGVLSISLGWSRNLDSECSSCHSHVHGDWVALTVTDTGGGIAPSDIDSIFNPFFTTKEVGKGTGLGMAVIHGIMRNHNGHILVESESGKGTTFKLLFQPTNEYDSSVVEAASVPASDQQNGKGKHVLIVDDEQELGNFIALLLESKGYRTTALTSSLQALEVFSEKPDDFALMITDQTMPEMTGTELTEKIRELSPDFPVILCTGYSEVVDEKGADAMDIGYLKKPARADELLETVGNYLKAS